MKLCISFLLFFTILASCEKLEDVSPLTPTSSELQGKWELQSASCFCFFSEDFDFGAHKLEFNANGEQVVVENSGDTFFVTDAGTYPIVVNNDRITIKNSLEYTFKIKSDTLILNFVDNPQIADDEISLTYLKM
jgi:hypothetical protein